MSGHQHHPKEPERGDTAVQVKFSHRFICDAWDKIKGKWMPVSLVALLGHSLVQDHIIVTHPTGGEQNSPVKQELDAVKMDVAAIKVDVAYMKGILEGQRGRVALIATNVPPTLPALGKVAD